MGHSYTELFYHFVWATRGREPYITDVLERPLYAYIRAKCGEMKILVHALNGMPDHVHLCCTLPTTMSISQALEQIKGSSSHYVNRELMNGSMLYWQPGYGALTVSKYHLSRVISYIDNQKKHHSANDLSAKLELTEDLSPL